LPFLLELNPGKSGNVDQQTGRPRFRAPCGLFELLQSEAVRIVSNWCFAHRPLGDDRVKQWADS
jgi:hypothetical protein